MLRRVPALWECLPVYLPCSTQHMTDDHLRHLSRPIVHAPYRTGPSSRRADSPILLTLLLLFHPFVGGAGVCRREGGVTPHAALLSLTLETDTSPSASCKKLSTLLFFFLSPLNKLMYTVARVVSFKLFYC